MQRYLASQLLMAMVVIIAVTVVAFLCIRFIPADVVDIILGPHATPEAETALRHRLGLDQPPIQQYLRWLGGLFCGDLGHSLRTGEPVIDMLRQRAPVTVELAFLATLIAAAIGLPAGVVAAIRQYSVLDQLSTAISMLGLSIPDFWLATLLMLVFSVTLRLLPPGGPWPTPFEDPWANLKRMAMPALSIGLPSAAVYFRMMRSSMLEVIGSGYIVTAYSKGLRERKVILGHALKNAAIPVLTAGALEVTWLLGGVFIIEMIFGLPGLGRATVQAIYMRDFTVLQGCLLFYTLIVVGISTCLDVLYGWVDPRIGLE